MGLNFFTTDNMENTWLKIFLYGPSGSGKTRAISTLPDLSKVFIISAEKGTLSLKDHKIGGCLVSSLQDVQEVYEYFKSEKDKGRFEWICLDSVTDICDTILAREKKANRNGMAAYGQMADSVLGLIKKFRDLPRNVYVTAHAKRVQDESGAFVWEPDCPGKTVNHKLPYFFDECFAVMHNRNEAGEVQTVVQTNPDDRAYAKDRSGSLSKYEELDLAAIAAKIKG